MKLRILALLLVLLLGNVHAVFAQEDERIGYGDAVEGELTVDGATFTFEGEADDIVIVRVRETERFSDFDYPFLTLSDANGNTVAQSGEFPFKSAELAVRLNNDGVYTITLTSAPRNEPEETVGPYLLELIKPEELEAGETVTGVVDEQITVFYVVSTDRTPNFEISYERTNGTYFPPISINIVDNSESELIAIYASSGRMAEQSVFFLGDSNFNRYIVAVGAVGRRPTAGLAGADNATFELTLGE